MPVRGENRRLDNSNRTEAAAWFGQIAGDHLVKVVRLDPKAFFALVPIPSSEAVQGTTFNRFPARELTTVLAKELGQLGAGNVKMADALRRTEKMLSARKGGPRDAALLYPKLTLIGNVAGFDYVTPPNLRGGRNEQRSMSRCDRDWDDQVDTSEQIFGEVRDPRALHHAHCSNDVACRIYLLTSA